MLQTSTLDTQFHTPAPVLRNPIDANINPSTVHQVPICGTRAALPSLSISNSPVPIRKPSKIRAKKPTFSYIFILRFNRNKENYEWMK